MKTNGQNLARLAIVLGLLVLCGCPSQPSVPATVPATNNAAPSSAVQVPLRLIVVDDQPLGEAIQQQWEAAEGGKLEIKYVSSAEVVDRNQPLPATDIFIYPTELLGELAERELIAALPDESLNGAAFQRRDIFELVRQRECVWGERLFAVPFGSPQFVLLYREDIFKQLQLTPPTTWTEYQTLVERLSDEKTWQGVEIKRPKYVALEPVQMGWGGKLLLARAAAAVRHRNQYSDLFDYSTMQPLIDQPPFVRALEQLVAAEKTKSEKPEKELEPMEIFQAFLAGDCAVAITWPSRLSATSNGEGKPSTRSVGVAPLPGSDDVYNFRDSRWERRRAEDSRHVPLLGISGRLGSVARESRRARSALNLLTLLAGPEWSAKVASHSSWTTMFRESQMQIANTGVWGNSSQLSPQEWQRYGEVLRDIQHTPRWLFSPRIPGQNEYLRTLNQAVRQSLQAGIDPHAALHGCAEKWRAITDQLGKDSQQRAYRRSIGLEW